MTKRIVIGIICILMLSVFFVGCANTEPSATPTPTPRITNTPKATTKNTDAIQTQPVATPDVTVTDGAGTSPAVTTGTTTAAVG